MQPSTRSFRRTERGLRATAVLLLFATAGGMRHAPVPPTPPEPTPDVAEYDTEVRFDLDAAEVIARSTLRFVVDERTAGSFSFRLSPSLQLRGIRGPGVRGYRTEAQEFRNEFVVELDGTLSPGTVATVEVEYSGPPSYWRSRINEISPDWVQLSIDSGWHPELSHVRSVTGVVRLHLPAEWSVVGSGAASFEEGVHVLRNAIPQVDVSFAAAPRLERTGAEGFTIHYPEARRADVPLVAEAAASCSRYLDGRYGADDPLPHVHLVLTPRSTATFARKNFIPLSSLGANATPVGVHRFLCHELAHFWTASNLDSPADHWMSEAFAEYVAGRSLRERFGQEEFDRWIATKQERGREHGPVWTPELTRRVPDPAMYDRAPYLLSRLEERIGTERFEAWLHAYMTERIASTEVLLRRLEEIGGAGAAAWFRQELAGAGR